MEFDPLNSPSRSAADPVMSNSPFSSLFASSAIPLAVEPPLIDFSTSPSPPAARIYQSSAPVPHEVSFARHTLLAPVPPTSTAQRRSKGSRQFSVLEDSFSDFPPNFSLESTANGGSGLGTVREELEEEGGLVSFIQDSPPRHARDDRENESPSRRCVKGKRWSVMSKIREEQSANRRPSLSPVKEAINASSPFSSREGDSIVQISAVDLSLIQDEAGSFLLQDDDESVMISQQFDRPYVAATSPGNLSQIGEEEEEEELERQEPRRLADEDASEPDISVGLSTMFLNHRRTDDVSLLASQSRFVQAQPTEGFTFNQSTLPRHFDPHQAHVATSTLPRSSSSILPPELVSPVKLRNSATNARPRPLSAPGNPFIRVDPIPKSASCITQDQSRFDLPLPRPEDHDEHSFLNKSSQSFINECKTPRPARVRQARSSDSIDVSITSNKACHSSDPTGLERSIADLDTSEIGFTQLLGQDARGADRTSDTSTAILNQLPPNAVMAPETTRTIELCLQAPLEPDRSETDLSSSTRTITDSRGSQDEVDLMGMEEPSLLYQNQTLAFSGDLTIENQSILLAGSSAGNRETGAERLKRRMAELRAAQQNSLYSIPATPTAKPARPRFVSLLDQTPQVSAQPQLAPRSTVRRPVHATSNVGTLIALETPSSSRMSSTMVTPSARPGSTTTRRIQRSSLAPAPSPLHLAAPSRPTQAEPPKTPGERKESTRARLERMRVERKVREEELLRQAASPAKPAPNRGGASGIRRSNSVGNNRIDADGPKLGITRSRSSMISDASSGHRRGGSVEDNRALASTRPKTSTASSTVMPPSAAPTSRRTSLLQPVAAASSKIAKRPSLLPSLNGSKPAGSGLPTRRN
ncbi:uncharacterized protein JCM15063_005743 [Sporobolomyces koalae]|uniref:uncharacterized protein n=1 Tax=Sporobolomyces koalae TaxID=500713 RepID=UPI003170BFBE